MGQSHQLSEALDDEQDYLEAVNDDEGRSRPASRADTLRARRRVEALLEDRRLKRAIEDDWMSSDEEE